MSDMKHWIKLIESAEYSDPAIDMETGDTGDIIDTITLDVPLLIRMLEYSREDAETDIDLHNVAGAMIRLGNQGTLTMADYDEIINNVKADDNAQDLDEKSVSKAQQRAAGIALAAKRGEMPKSELRGASKEMAKMSIKDLEDFASTKHKGLPKKVKKK